MVNEAVEKLRDKDFIETKDGFYQVIGYIHTKESIIAIPRYIKVDYATYWYKEGCFYKRALHSYSSSAVEEAIKEYSERYLKFNRFYGTKVPEIPYNEIRKIYYTNNYERYVKKDILYKRFLEILDLFSKETNIGKNNFGLTSTMLIGLSNPIVSDIDIVVYGFSNVLAIKEFIKNTKSVSKFTEYDLDYESKIRKVDKNFLKKIIERKWNRIIYKNREASINPVKSFEEIIASEEIIKCENISPIEKILEVVHAKNPFYFPLEYKVNCEDSEIEELAIFNDFFIDCLEKGDILRVKGLLQRVHTKERTYYRIAFGVREIPDQIISLISSK